MRGLSSVILLTATALSACSVYDTSLFKKQGAGSGGTAGSDGGGGAGGGAGGNGTGGTPANLCAGKPSDQYPATYPPKPDPSQVVTPGGDIEFVAVQYSINLGDSANRTENKYLNLGFNLDKTCTTSANLKTAAGTGGCVLPDYATGVQDGPGGLDNAMGLVIQSVRDLTGNVFSSENYTTALQRGSSNVIFKVSQWNGEPNDDEVLVETYIAAPFHSFSTDGGGAMPKWDGTDVWPIASDSLIGSDIKHPAFADSHAYVADNKVVASLKNTTLRLDVGLSSQGNIKLKMQLHTSIIVCELAKWATDGGARYQWYSPKCTLGGYWRADDLVQQLGQFPNPVSNPPTPLCAGTSTYRVFRDNLCSQIDSYSSGAPGATDECDAITIGLTWETRPALLGSVFQVEPVADPCAANPSEDPANDSCANHGLLGPVGFDGGAGTGGTTGSGGNPGTGGTTGSGGNPGTGGTMGSGGNPGTGGTASDSGIKDASTTG